MRARFMKLVSRRRVWVAAAIFLLWAVMVFSQRHLSSSDTQIQLAWWNYLAAHGWHGIATMDNGGLGYTSIWYFLIAVFTKLHLYPNFPIEYNIKLLAVLFTLASSITTYFIVKHVSGKNSLRPIIAALLILFIPAFFGDIVKTNLPDSSYILFCLMALLAFVHKKYWLTWLLVGVGMAFKLMSMYFLPFIVFYYLLAFRKTTWFNRVSPLFLIVGFLACSVPGLIAGLSFYDATIGTISDRVVSNPNVSSWNFWAIFPGGASWPYFPSIPADQVRNMIVFGYAAIILIIGVIYVLLFNIKNKKQQDRAALWLLIVSPLVFWMFMPTQGETYFALASVFSMIVYIITLDRKDFLVFGVLTYLSWLAYNGFAGLLVSGAKDIAYIILLVIGFLVWRIWGYTEFSKTLKAETVTKQALH